MKRILFIFCLCMAVLSLSFFVQPSYAQQTGTLQVIIHPAGAVSAGAQWKVNAGQHGGQWQNSGAELQVPAGVQCFVDFKDIPGYTAPFHQAVNVASGRSFTLESGYTQWSRLRVQLNPQNAVAAGAQWRVDSGPWQNHGAIVEVAPGRSQVDYKNIDTAGWARERESEGVTIVSGQPVTLTGNYSPRGYLNVTIQPQEAVRDTSQWSVDGGRVWHNSGRTVYVVSGNQHIVFRGIEGKWIIPDPIDRILEVGRTLQVTQTFQARPGSLTVTIFPQEAVSAGAQWRTTQRMKMMDSPWRNSGTTVEVPIGQYQLEFKEIPRWVKPANQDVNVENNVHYPRTATYIRQ